MDLFGSEKFGWSYPKRKAFFKEAEGGVRAHHQLEFMGKIEYLPILRVPIELPKYRLLNGRTSSAQQEYLADHPDLPEDFFSRDSESLEAQKVQHELLWKMVQGKNLLSYFKDKDGAAQQVPIILDNNGFVINGNRRLCAWRTLYYDRTDEHKRFQHIDVVVLPPGDEKAIDELEGSLQVQPDIREDYSWDSLANMMRHRQKSHNWNNKELAKFYKVKESEVKELLDMLDYAEVYLESRGVPKKWSVVPGEFAFREIVKGRQALKSSSIGDKKLFEEVSFNLLDDSKGGRLYDAIPLARKYQSEIEAALLVEFPVSPSGHGEIVEDLFGTLSQTSVALPLAETIAVPANREKAREVIRDVIESQKELDKEKNSADYLLKQLRKANGCIQAALSAGLKADSNRMGVSEQIESINAGLARIRVWLDNHA